MGKISFRRIAGHIVPILESGGRKMILPEHLSQPIKNVRLGRRHIAESLSKPSLKAKDRFIIENTKKFNKGMGKEVGRVVASFVGKRKK